MLEYMALINGQEMPKGEIALPDGNKKPQGNFFDMFRERKEAIAIVIQWFLWWGEGHIA